MKTIPFRDALHDVASMLGLEPEDSDSSNFDRFQAAALTRHINRHVRRAWEFFPWPEFEPIELRYFRDVWASGPYAAGAEVYHEDSDAYYFAAANVTGADVPGSAADWQEMGVFSRHIALAQTGRTEIGEAISVTALNPTTNDYPAPIPFTISVNGVQLPAGGTPNTVWLRFRQAPNRFTSAPWTAQSYTAGDRVFSRTTGECYMARVNALAGNVPGTSNVWTRIEFPSVFSGYVVQAAYADALREQGQNDRARAEMALAQEYLTDAMASVVVIQGQIGRFSIEQPPVGTIAAALTAATHVTPPPPPSMSHTADSTEGTADTTLLTADAA